MVDSLTDDIGEFPAPPSSSVLTAPPPAAAPESAPVAPEPATPDSAVFKFIGGEGTIGDRVQRVETFLEGVAPYLQLVYLAYQNIQREQQKSTELWTYVCKGPDPKGPSGICNLQMQAKRPEFRTYAERLICPNPVHNGELTLMEPILPS